MKCLICGTKTIRIRKHYRVCYKSLFNRQEGILHKYTTSIRTGRWIRI